LPPLILLLLLPSLPTAATDLPSVPFLLAHVSASLCLALVLLRPILFSIYEHSTELPPRHIISVILIATMLTATTASTTVAHTVILTEYRSTKSSVESRAEY
jgi:hypothetical protein